MKTTPSLAALLVGASALLAVAGCPPSEPPPLDLSVRLAAGEARAGVVAKDADLIGGPTAVGAVGDYKLYNSRIAVIVEAPGPSDGYGTYGGLVVDADVVRPAGEPGRSSFGEAIPMYQFRTVRGTRAEVLNDGRDGSAAVLRVHAEDAPFPLIEAVLGQTGGTITLKYELDYVLEPDAPFLRIVTRGVNPADGTHANVNAHFVGYVMGDGLRMFLPGYGFDIPSVPEAGDYFAGATPDVSYSFVADSSFAPVAQFQGFQLGALAPFQVAPGDSNEIETHLVVGDGDLAAHLPLHRTIRQRYGVEPESVSVVTGSVRDLAGAGLPGALVHVREGGSDRYVTRTKAREGGAFSLELPAGAYRFSATMDGRDPGAEQAVTVAGATSVALALGATGSLMVHLSEGGRPVPAKIQLRRAAAPGALPTSFGLEPRHLGFERIEFLPPGGGTLELAPGDWSVLVSRGFEYEVVSAGVAVRAGQTAMLDAALVRSVDTSGWLGGDYHVHAQWSPDSDDLVDDKVRAFAAEGLEVAVSTEHDYVGDFAPVIARLGLGAWVRGLPGCEISTTPYGHFNAFPLVRDATLPNFGFVPWYGVKGDDLMKLIRAKPGRPYVQANHPRSGSFGSPIIKGYFSAVGLDPATLRPQKELNWSTDYDGIEIANGGRPDFEDWFAFLARGYRMLATGDSDSHTARSDVVGYPRNYVRSGTDDPSALDEGAYMDALRAGRLTVSGGFFVEASAGDAGAGGFVSPSSGKIPLRVRVQAPGFVPAARGEVVVNGAVAATFEVPGEPVRPGLRVDRVLEVDVPGEVDAFVVVRVDAGSMSPVYPGLPAFGFTNPLFVDANGNGRFDGRLPRD
jgi:hypothetical protein